MNSCPMIALPVTGNWKYIIGVIEAYRYNPLYLEADIANANRGTILTYGDYLFTKNKPLNMSLRVSIHPAEFCPMACTRIQL
jgi:hypothetical protein